MSGTKFTLPKTMRAVQVHAYDGKPESITVEEIPTPQPKAGQVIVKMAATPINPSDLLFMRGEYGFKRPTPTTPGFEASGLVVAGGSGPFARLMLGNRVACTAQEGDGTWAEYICADAMRCIKLPKNVDDEQGAMLLANPVTAVALYQTARNDKHKAAIHTAAASSLGKILLKYADQAGFPIIHIVRREEQVAELKGLGGRDVLNSSDPDFVDQLRALAGQLKATIAFDAVSGELTEQLIRAMPDGSRVLVYGLLSDKPTQLNARQLIFENKSVEGFWFPKWIEENGLFQTLLVIRKSLKIKKSGETSRVAERIPLNRVHDATAQYEKNMTRGKILLVP